MRLFLYGTLLRPQTLARLAGGTLTLPTTLPVWRRVRRRGTPFPTLRRARGTVAGAVVTVDVATLRRLNAYEGMRYRLRKITVRSARGTLIAQS